MRKQQQHRTFRAAAQHTCDLGNDLFVDTLFRGFARCMDAEARLDECVSERDLELAREQLCRVKLELQQALDDYTDARIRRWLGAPSLRELRE
jgi:hypothetical protein